MDKLAHRMEISKMVQDYAINDKIRLAFDYDESRFIDLPARVVCVVYAVKLLRQFDNFTGLWIRPPL